MDLPLETIEVWQVSGEFEARAFLKALVPLLVPGDVALFGAYEPTEKLTDALVSLGATSHAHIDGFFMCFDLNRSKHPHGCAFRCVVSGVPFEEILSLDPAVLAQKDIPSFYDHFVAYRPGAPLLPLITFHDAAYGGTLYLSGHYSAKEASGLAERLSAQASRVRNPVLEFR